MVAFLHGAAMTAAQRVLGNQADACAGSGPGAAKDAASGAAEPPARHEVPSSFDEARLAKVLAAKRSAREAGIAGVLEASRACGRPVDRVIAALTYDLELAPHTTNRVQLEELGYKVPDGPISDMNAAKARRALWHIVYGLERLGVYLLHTDHLSDRRLLEVLCSRVLVEQVRDLAPSGDFSEFIDLTASREDGAPAAGPDGLQGPFDHQPDQEEDASEVLRSAESQSRPIADRDRFLPMSRISREGSGAGQCGPAGTGGAP